MKHFALLRSVKTSNNRLRSPVGRNRTWAVDQAEHSRKLERRIVHLALLVMVYIDGKHRGLLIYLSNLMTDPTNSKEQAT